MDILENTIDELDLTTRCYYSLKNANIETLRDLISKTESDLAKKGFDHWSLKEIHELLAECGLRLRDEESA